MKTRFGLTLIVPVLLGAVTPTSIVRGIENNGDQKQTNALIVVNEAGKTTSISAEDYAKFPRQTMKVKDHSGTLVTYEGVSLAEILRAAGVTLGKDLKGPLLANGLLVEATDGYRVVFALPEIDPAMTDNVVLVADRKDAKPLEAKEGPYRLVVPHEKRPARWVKQVIKFSVVRVGELAKQK
jgi:hypothetical protein